MARRFTLLLPDTVKLPNYIGELKQATQRDGFISEWISNFHSELINPQTATQSQDVVLYVLWHLNTPVAIGALHDGVRLNLIYVPPRYRNQGFGKAITIALASLVRSNGNTPTLNVSSNNTTALRLYTGLGFAPHYKKLAIG